MTERKPNRPVPDADDGAAPSTVSDQNHEETHPDLAEHSGTEDEQRHRERTSQGPPDSDPDRDRHS